MKDQSHNTMGAAALPAATGQAALAAWLEFSPDVLCSLDRHGRFVQVSAAALSIWGYRPDELEETYFHHLVAREDRQRSRQALETVVSGGTLNNLVLHCRCKDGSLKPLSWSAKWNADQGVMYCVVKKGVAQVFEDMVESFGDAFYTLDGSWNITYWNSKAEHFTHLKNGEALGCNLWDLFPEGRELKFYSEFHRAVRERCPVHFEEYSPTYRVWLEVHAQPTGDGLAVCIKNITARKHQELEHRLLDDKLQQARQNLFKVLESMSDGFYTVDRHWTITYATDRMAAMMGVNKEDYLGKNHWESFPASVHTKFYSEYHRAFAQNTLVTFEEYLPTFQRWVEINAYPTQHELSIYVKDITERKKQEKRLEFMAKATSEVIWERAVDSDEVEINGDKLKQLFGYEAVNNRLSMSFWISKIHPDDVQATEHNRKHALAHGLDSYVNEYRVKRHNGSWAYVKNRIHIIQSEEGKPLTLIGAVEDVTGEYLAAQALLDSERSYRQLFDNAPLPTIISDARTLQILDVNSEAVEQYGYSREELLGMTIFDLHPPEEHHRVAEDAAAVKSNTRHSTGTITNLKKGGERMQVEVSVTTMLYKGKTANLATIKDVTGQVQLQQQLVTQEINHQRNITKAAIEAQEKERSEIGRELHDNVNQILTSAKLYVENIRYYPEQSAAFIEKGTSLLQKSINEIRRLSRALVTPTLSDVSFKDTLHELVASYRELHLFEVESSFVFDEALINKEIRLTIYRILQEGFHNTVKYANASLVRVTVLAAGATVQVHYRDNGIGFDPLSVKRGIGLNNIQNRTEAYRGSFRIHSTPGQGFRMLITFPL